MSMLFRDHFLSDLIGFVYSRMEPAAAAHHFLDRIRENCATIHDSGRDALVPIILDGENAWEYLRPQRPAVPARALPPYRDDTGLSAVTVSEALERVEADACWITSSRVRGSTRTSTSGSARRRTTRPGNCCSRPRRAYDETVDGQGGSTLSEADRRLGVRGDF